MIGIIIAWLIVAFVFLDVITSIAWIRRQDERDKTLLMAFIAATIALLAAEYALYALWITL